MTARVETYVGAGGKTTTIFFRALKARQLGKKVAVVTTTHMMRPRQGFVPGDLPAGWKEQWRNDGIIVVGTALDNGKITYPGDGVYEALCELSDLVLVEGDGSRRMPLKVMGSHEPVIPENCDDVYCLAGLSALGQTAGKACFRHNLLGLPEDEVITERLMTHIVEEGCLARLGSFWDRTTVILNQADDEALFQCGHRILQHLSRPGRMTAYEEEARNLP